MSHWQQIHPHIWRFPDSCNVYAVHGPDGMLIVDAGTGLWLDRLDELPAEPVAVACTHYFRDHAAGALPASRRGIPVFVPEGEREFFEDPESHFRRRETYIIYDNLWNLAAPIEGIDAAGGLQDYERLRLAGLDCEVVPLPGATLGQIGLAVGLPAAGAQVVFCGETIHSPGRVPRVAPFQYNYNDLGGATNAYYSAGVLLDRSPAMLLPSLGEPIGQDIPGALQALRQALRDLCGARAGMTGALDRVDERPDLIRVTDHIWLGPHSSSLNWFVISDSGKALALDYGYNNAVPTSSGYPFPAQRRVLLHDLDALQKQFGIDRVDVVLASHFHDDHVCGIPLLQRLHGTECWAAENFADLMERPEAHCFPCNWPTPATVNRRIALDETVQWEEYSFHFAPMSGHTRFASLIGFEADGKRIAHTGDQYFFFGDGPYGERRRMQNHVYRNGARLDGYDQSGRWMLDWRPDIVISGHQEAFFTDDAFFQHMEGWIHDYRTLHEAIMPLGEADTHFDLDSWGGWIWPYRTHLSTPSPARVDVTIRNPFPRQASLELRLVGPTGWSGTAATLTAAPRAEVSVELEIVPDGPCRRQAFAVELTADGQPFGQVAEALLTVGGQRF